VNDANIGQIVQTHSPYLSLKLNAFESSLEFIALCLDSDGCIRLGPWDGAPEIVLPEPIPLPEWQADKGELWFRGHLIKKFVRRAENQRSVLDAFEREQWAHEIRNPFLESVSEHSEKRAAELLTRTVEGLNEDHKKKNLLRFGYKSMGDVVYWK
jgi:hypothetical protein